MHVQANKDSTMTSTQCMALDKNHANVYTHIAYAVDLGIAS